MNCAQREEETEKKLKRMKITWKKQSKGSNRKRSLAASSNLPFEDEEAEQPTSTMEAKVEEEGEFRGLKTLDSSDGPSTQQLADSFQAQGDKLAEVLDDIFFLFLLILIIASVSFYFIFSATKQDLSFRLGFVCTLIHLGYRRNLGFSIRVFFMIFLQFNLLF